jgi:hypothetical protein
MKDRAWFRGGGGKSTVWQVADWPLGRYDCLRAICGRMVIA